MIVRILCAWVTLGFSATAAMAQAIPAMLPAHEISGIVREAGFTPLSPAMRRGQSYVLRAAGRDGREMRIVIDARSGTILSAAPVVAAAGDAVRGERMGPYEPMPGYVPPGVYQAGPPIVYEGDRPMRRPLASIPNVPQRRAAVPDAMDDQPLAEPPSLRDQPPIMREERGEHGLLPPPPERFPQRTAPAAAPKPAAKPAPVKRAAASPPATPLPKPRPEPSPDSTPAAAADKPAVWGEPAPDSKPDPRALPH